MKHSQTPTHQQREGLLQLQPMGGEELAAIFTIRKTSDGDTGENVNCEDAFDLYIYFCCMHLLTSERKYRIEMKTVRK